MTPSFSRRTLLAAGGAAFLPAAAGAADLFIPQFEFVDWDYQSFLVLPTDAESAAGPGSAVTARKWAAGKLILADAVEEFAAGGKLTLAPGAFLDVHVKFSPGKDGGPAEFHGTGTGTKGPTKGAVYELNGWVFGDGDVKVDSVRGAVRAVRGPDKRPEIELGMMPVGTVGAFVISRAQS